MTKRYFVVTIQANQYNPDISIYNENYKITNVAEHIEGFLSFTDEDETVVLIVPKIAVLLIESKEIIERV